MVGVTELTQGFYPALPSSDNKRQRLLEIAGWRNKTLPVAAADSLFYHLCSLFSHLTIPGRANINFPIYFLEGSKTKIPLNIIASRWSEDCSVQMALKTPMSSCSTSPWCGEALKYMVMEGAAWGGLKTLCNVFILSDRLFGSYFLCLPQAWYRQSWNMLALFCCTEAGLRWFQ